jgi:CHAD domain-containing protein
MTTRVERGLARATRDRNARIATGAAGTAVAAGAAIAAGKAAVDRLRSDEDSGPSRAYRLKPQEKPAKGIRRIAAGRAEKALEELREAERGAFAESVHEARKDLKKTRAVVRLVRDRLGDDAYRRENRRFRDAGRSLAAARDAEVKLETLSELRERFGNEFPGERVEPFERILREERDATTKAQEQAAQEGNGGGALAAAEEAVALGRKRIPKWPLGGDSWELVGPGLVRTYRRGRSRFGDVLDSPSPEAVHEWRKRVKDLWYQLRIVGEAWPPVLGETADQAHELADRLGDHHDLALVAAEVEARPEAFTGAEERKALLELVERRQGELLEQAIALGHRLYAEKPKAFRRRLAGYWQAWRANPAA